MRWRTNPSEPFIPPTWGSEDIREAIAGLDTFFFRHPDDAADKSETRAAYVVRRYWRLIAESIHIENDGLKILSNPEHQEFLLQNQGAVEIIAEFIKKDAAFGLASILDEQLKKAQERERETIKKAS